MSVKYFDICDTPFKRDGATGVLSILRPTSDGKVIENKPSFSETEKFARNWSTSCVIDEETAYKLALNPALSY